MILFPNAKINIGLNIVKKRKDGFHSLQTVFYPITIFQDKLEINRTTTGVDMVMDNATFQCPAEDNLCVKAFRLLQKHYPIDGVHIRLTKHIPTGAGLGGGSADGAYALKMYNTLFDLRLSSQQLQHYAARLGSDVAFFIDNVPAFATGRGERLTPLPALDLSAYTIRLVTPSVFVSTGEAYRSVLPKRPTSSLKIDINKPVEQWSSLIKNDFEDSLFIKFPSLKKIKEQLYAEGAIFASLSGSGSALFGIFPKELS